MVPAEGFLRDQAFVEHLVQFDIIMLCVRLVDKGFGLIFGRSDVHNHVSVVRTAHQVLNRIDQAVAVPVITENRETRIGNSLRCFRIGRDKAFNQVKILVQRGRSFVIIPGDDLLLQEESRAV